MKVIFGKTEVPLSDMEVKKAKKLINEFFDKIKKESVKNNVPSFYFTCLIVGYIMLNDAIKSLTPSAAKIIMEATVSGENRRKQIDAEKARYGLKND